jgi:SAM-dependent methyltransferase
VTTGDRFEELAQRLAGFYGVWVVYVGLELGFFAALRAAGGEGLTSEALAARCGTASGPTRVWCLAALAHELVEADGQRFRLEDGAARVLLDAHLPDYLGGQFVHAAVASLDYGGILEVIRSGRPAGPRPDRYRASIERLTLQDIAVFFQEALTQFPELVADLARGLRVADVHCGGGRWLVAMARRFPASRFVGFEAETDSLARAQRTVAEAGLGGRITLVPRPHPDPAADGRFDLVYFQYALHEEEATRMALAAGWGVLSPGGRLLALDWALPSDPEEWVSLHGQLVAGIQLDHLLDGTRLRTEGEYLALFAEAGLPPPQVVDLPSGALVFHLRRSGG